MVFDKYITIKDSQAVIGMYPSTMAWYCKELKGEIKDLDQMIIDVTKILNEHNNRTIRNENK